ncbi:MAG: DUF4249 domain-containing protein [Cyclobacteriaceae bacterium]
MSKYWFILSLCFGGCIEPYAINSELSVKAVAVDGLFTNAADGHYVRLTNTYALSEASPAPISGAKVIVEGETISIVFVETNPGYYEPVENVAGVPGQVYQLIVELTDGTIMKSSTIAMPSELEIDSLYALPKILPSTNSNLDEAGFQFFVSAHDPEKQNFNVRYEFQESFQINVPLPSEYIFDYEDSIVVPRDTLVATCFRKDRSNEYLIGTTSGLGNPQLTEFPLRFKSQLGPELSSAFYLSVKQYAITNEAYEYYRVLSKNNTSAGSLFDTQKGSVIGNVHVEGDDDVIVQGFFEVSTMKRQDRQFDAVELFENNEDIPIGTACLADEFGNPVTYTVLASEVGRILKIEGIPFVSFTGAYWRIVQHAGFGQAPPGLAWSGGTGALVIIANRTCSDCTYYGLIDRPDFWRVD